jgi:hypothetical protein
MKHASKLEFDIAELDHRITLIGGGSYTGEEVRTGLWRLLETHPAVASTLRARIDVGKIDGSTYYGRSPEGCRCYKGVAAECGYYVITYNFEPIEAFCRGVRPGHTVETSPVLAMTVEMIDLWERARA